MNKNVSKNYVSGLNTYYNVLAIAYCVIGICEILATIFIALKLFEVIGWKWIYVLMPIGISMIIAVIMIIIRLVITSYYKKRIRNGW